MVINILAKFDHLDPKLLKNFNSEELFNYLKLTLKSHQKIEQYIQSILETLDQRSYFDKCLKYYFETTMDESYFKKLVEMSLKKDPEFAESESFSFYHILKILGKKIDLENYPYKKCKFCHKPLGMCKEKNLNSVTFEERFNLMKKEFEKGNYLETIKICMEIEMNKEVSKFIINSYIHLNRMSEALHFINFRKRR